MAHIHKSILIHAPVEKVYEFARDPKHWNTFYVGLSEPEKIEGKGEKGTVVKQHYLLAGMSFPVTSRVLEDKADPKEARWKGEIEGPLAGKQEWIYKAKGKDTEVISDVEYTVPGKAVGKIVDRLIIEKMQERSAEQTLENLKLLCEAQA
jgi:coenzyme Q-binding protein COQ10